MQTKKFVQDLKDEIVYEKNYKYQMPFEKGEYYQTLDTVIRTSLEDEKLVIAYFDFLRDLFVFHFEYSTFVYTELHETSKAIVHLSKAIHYGEIIATQAPKTCGCRKGNNPFILSNKAVFLSSMFLLLKKEEAFKIFTDYMIASLNGENCIIKKGYNKASISWFVLKLFSISSKEEITLHKLLQPKLDQKYVDILENWDTTDVNEVVFMIDVLCELHLAQATLDLADADAHDEDDINNLRYRELFIPALYAFPYEILTWLKLREQAGLKNPKTFTHPLMNTPIAKMFLDIKEPLPYPTELPYAKELLEKLKEQCPDVEIPEWLGSSDVETPTSQQSENILPEDFME